MHPAGPAGSATTRSWSPSRATAAPSPRWPPTRSTRSATARGRSASCSVWWRTSSPAAEVDVPHLDHLVAVDEVETLVLGDGRVDVGGDHTDAVAEVDAHPLGEPEGDVLVGHEPAVAHVEHLRIAVVHAERLEPRVEHAPAV